MVLIYWRRAFTLSHSRRRSLEGQEKDPTSKFLGIARLRNELELSNAIADRDARLMRVDEACEISARPLALSRFSQEILIL